MLIGHYGAAFGLRSTSPAVPLWVFFLAVQAVDIAFFVLAPLDIEILVLLPGQHGPLAMDLVSIPYSHSLLLNLAYTSVIVVVGFAVGQRRIGVLLAIAFFSHWTLDLIVHQHDLRLTPSEQTKVGWGLWSPALVGLAIELTVLAVGGWLWLRTLHGTRERRLVIGSLAVLAVIQVGYVALPPLRPIWLFALGAQVLYLGLAAGAWWLERRLRLGAPSTA